MCRRIGVPLDGDHVRAEALQGDRQLAAELSGAQQHDRRPVAVAVPVSRLVLRPAVSHRFHLLP
jgi:hypothetical protein